MLSEEDFDEPEPPEDVMSFDDDDEAGMVLDNNPDEEFVEFDPTGRYGRYADVLGKGAMKTVYKAYDMVDCKEVAWNKAKPSIEGPVEQVHAVEREVCFLQRLTHKGIIKLYSAWVDEASGDTNFITELCSSSLLAFRLKHKRVSRKAVKSWARQILEGLLHLHAQDPPIIHRDLKCENIFVKYNSSTVLKIGDFGSATVLDETHHMHTLVGTPEFMAPEMFQEDYDELVDVYSFGMCMLELLTRECPYSECKSLAQIYKKVVSGKKPESLLKVKDAQALQFINRCLLPASKRPSAKELLADPFLQHKEVSVHPVQAMKPSCSIPSLRNHTGNVCKAAQSCGVNNANIASRDAVCALNDAPLRRSYQVMGTVEDENTLCLRIRIQESSRCSNIVFQFDLRCDTPKSVAEEMVRTLAYPQTDMLTIADLISEELAVLTLNEEGLAARTCFVDVEGSMIKEQKSGNLFTDTTSSESQGSLVNQAGGVDVDAKLQLGQNGDSCIHGTDTPIEGQQENIGMANSNEKGWLENTLSHKSYDEYATESRSSRVASWVKSWDEIAMPTDYVKADHSFYGEMLATDGKSSAFDMSSAPLEETLAEIGKISGEKGCSVIAKVVTEENTEFLFDKNYATLIIDGTAGVSKTDEPFAESVTSVLKTDEMQHDEPFMESATWVLKENSGSSAAGKCNDLCERSSTAVHNKRLCHLVKNFLKFKQRSAIVPLPLSEQSIQRPRPLYVNSFA